MFVELTEESSNAEIKINFNNILSYSPRTEGGTQIMLDPTTVIHVNESYYKVKQLEEHQVAAERGY